jgi:hypothetical protein
MLVGANQDGSPPHLTAHKWHRNDNYFKVTLPKFNSMLPKNGTIIALRSVTESFERLRREL